MHIIIKIKCILLEVALGGCWRVGGVGWWSDRKVRMKVGEN